MFRLFISPAKKMEHQDFAYEHALPAYITEAEELFHALEALERDQLKQLWACSDALCDENIERFEELRDYFAGNVSASPALMSYVGIQFQHMAPQVMREDELAYLQNHLRILSGMFGCLKPFDAIVAYRLEMQAKLAVNGNKDLYAFWGEKLFDELTKDGTETLVNLASKEYSKAVEPYAKDIAFITCNFYQEDKKKGKLVQRSTEAKSTRGAFVRWCAEQALEEVADVRDFRERDYLFAADISDEKTFNFIKQS